MLDLSNYKLTFDDEFNGLSLSSQGGTWQPAYSWSPNGFADSTMTSWLVNPAWGPTSAADANVYSNSNGVTSIAFKPRPADVKASDVGGKDFLSGQLTTKTSFSQAYGYFEASMRLPAAAGLNSAFWLLPADGSWPPELDVVELLGNDPTTMVMTAHDDIGGGQDKANPTWTTIPDASKAFHRYGVDWQPDKLTWYFDGNQVAQQATPASMSKPMYMLLDTLSGTSGSWIGAPTAGETAHMDIDYVRVYSAAASAVAVTPQAGYIPYDNASGAVVAGATPATKPAAGTPMSTLTVKVSEDAWQGDAQFTIAVDGATIGGTRTATASHAQGQSGTVTLTGQWGAGPHTIAIAFLNDAYGGTPSTDRNLYVDQVAFNGSVVGGPKALYSAGTKTFQADSARDTILRIGLSEDAWKGDAQYAVSVDGVSLGGGTATASHAAGNVQFADLLASLASGTHDLSVSFLNDLYGGTPSTDRNLYVNSVEVGGRAVTGGSAALYSEGAVHFQFAIPAS